MPTIYKMRHKFSLEHNMSNIKTLQHNIMSGWSPTMLM